MELVDFCGQNEIVLRQAVDLVRPGRDLDFSAGKEEVRVVPLLLCKLADAVYEIEGFAKVGKREGLRKVVFFDDVPAVHPLSRAASSLPLSGGTPPRHGTQALVARSEITTAILAPRGAMLRTGVLASKRRKERFRRNSQGTKLRALEPGRDLV